MSLPAGQQRVLDRIEDGLRAHDSPLASMFGIFTRLTRHEEMPKAEQLRPGRRRAVPPARWRAGRVAGRPRWRAGQVADRPRWAPFVPISIVAVLSAVLIYLLVSSTQNGCPTGAVAVGKGSAVSRTGACPVRHAPFGPS